VKNGKSRKTSGSAKLGNDVDKPRPNVLVTKARTPHERGIDRMAEMAVTGLAANAGTTVDYSKGRLGDVDLTACLKALTECTERVKTGDLGDVKSLLTAQGLTLNTIFIELARCALLNKGEHLGATDSYMRLALKAQSQSRSTFETLALMQNGPAVFARQANIAHGPQQVNNGIPLARAGNSESEPNRLLEAHGERLDERTTTSTGERHQTVAPMGAIDRTAHD